MKRWRIVNTASGEVEQSGFRTKADAQKAQKQAVEATLAHQRAQHERALGSEDRSGADLSAATLAEVYREARDAGEDLSPSEALSRTQERIANAPASSGGAPAPGAVLHEGEPVGFEFVSYEVDPDEEGD